MAKWSFLTNHARVLVCIAQDPGVRLRDIADVVEITERSAYSIVTDLTADGYILKEKEGRRNRYHIEVGLPLRESVGRQRTIGEVLDLLVEAGAPRRWKAVRPGS
jgi:DNA-binding IclR family transcriptional regulator